MLLMGQVLLGVLAPLDGMSRGQCLAAPVVEVTTGITVAEPPRTRTGFLFHETRASSLGDDGQADARAAGIATS
jgi:hypothetical protein